MKYEVIRQHLGDKMYVPGDPETGMREAVPGDVQHLVNNGVLIEAKAERKPPNKAEPAVKNKADPLDHDNNGRKGGAKKAG